MRGKPDRGRGPPVHARFIPAHAGKTCYGQPCSGAEAVHPRACGENAHVDPGADAIVGSSPRMRGKRHIPRGSAFARRFIPAHAGKTGHDPGRHSPGSGSSPRMRGKRTQVHARAGLPRFIPAHAGKTQGSHVVAYAGEVHPRACGENVIVSVLANTSGGSSPRMRGKREGAGLPTWEDRFIPAHAGKTTTRSPVLSSAWVHPRACGENISNLDKNVTYTGSSPRMRGKPRGRGRRPVNQRFIPAHAGKTCSGFRGQQRLPVHPRACGENRAVRDDRVLRGGSSPRMRGKPAPPRAVPHCALVHPRACGENVRGACAWWAARGSSPRMRGKLIMAPLLRRRARFIPAHAGKTPRDNARPQGVGVHPRACGENVLT